MKGQREFCLAVFVLDYWYYYYSLFVNRCTVVPTRLMMSKIIWNETKVPNFRRAILPPLFLLLPPTDECGIPSFYWHDLAIGTGTIWMDSTIESSSCARQMQIWNCMTHFPPSKYFQTYIICIGMLNRINTSTLSCSTDQSWLAKTIEHSLKICGIDR